MSHQPRLISSSHAEQRRFVDRGVQTDDWSLPVFHSPERTASNARTIGDIELHLSRMSMSSTRDSSPTASSENFDSAYSHAADSSNDFDDSSPQPSITATTRELRRRQIPRAWPSALAESKATSRILSLPETISVYSAKEVLEKTTLRVVSMPLAEQYTHDIRMDSLEDVSTVGDEECPRVRMRSQVTDLPHTPSPPSSPESIVFIANKTQLPEGFLRHSAQTEGPQSTYPDDQGWVTWAKSPPRPIPALHGPLSLPYARCPSGAEGTIIEEPENLPRMIWGLEPGEDSTPARGRLDPAPRSHSTPNRATVAHQTSLPPRLQMPRSRVESVKSDSRGLGNRDKVPQNSDISHERKSHVAKKEHQEVLDTILQGQDPIDLNHLLRLHAESSDYGHDYEFSGGRELSSSISNLRAYHSSDEPELDWQAIFLGHAKPRNLGLSPSVSVRSNDHAGLESRGSLTSISGLSSTASSRSPIILDSLAGHFSHAFHESAPRRMSALEIAHKYRQQQLHQQHLPTPPSSSSPIWSSNFSPYQDSLWSPELNTTSQLSRMSPASFTQQSVPLHHASEPHKISYNKPNPPNAYNTDRKSRVLGSMSGSQAQDYSSLLHRPPPRSTTGCIPDAALMSSLAEYLQVHGSRLPGVLQVVAEAEVSPAIPRPPPNTPFAALASPREKSFRPDMHLQSSLTVTPPSPTSPKPRLRSFSHQQTRSIPLTRLIQRRLSSVPEEDLSSGTEHGHSTPISSPARTRSYSSGEAKSSGVHVANTPYLYTPPSPQQQSPSMRSPFHDVLTAHGHHEEPYTGPGWASLDSGLRPAQATVRLPNASLRDDQTGPALAHGAERDDAGRRKEGAIRGRDNGRARGVRRGGRGRKGRGMSSAPASAMNGPQRVDGGMMVRS